MAGDGADTLRHLVLKCTQMEEPCTFRFFAHFHNYLILCIFCTIYTILNVPFGFHPPVSEIVNY